MVNTVKAVATFLRESPTITFSVFENHRPAKVDDCITVVGNGGTVTDLFLGTADILRKSMVLVYVRSQTYAGAMAEIRAVSKALKDFTDTTAATDGDICYGLLPINGLEPLGVDDLNRTEFSLAYNVFVKE